MATAPSSRGLGSVPRAEAAFERLVVVAAAKSRRQLVEQPDVAAAEHDVLRGRRRAQQFRGFEHRPRATASSPSALKPRWPSKSSNVWPRYGRCASSSATTRPSSTSAVPSPEPRPRNSMRPPSSLPSACIAASLRMRTGLPSAAAQSKPTQPLPRFHGSSVTWPRSTGLGMPIVMTSYFQSAVLALTPSTTCCGVNPSPESNLRASEFPECINLTCVPPISTTNTRIELILTDLRALQASSPKPSRP